MTHRENRGDGGFVLVELLAAMLVAALVASLIDTVVVWGFGHAHRTFDRFDLQHHAQQTMAELVSGFYQSAGTYIDGMRAATTATYTVSATGADLTYKLPDGTSVDYAWDKGGATLSRSVGSGIAAQVLTDVTAFNLCAKSQAVQIQLVQQLAQVLPVNATYQTDVYPRNAGIGALTMPAC